MVSKSAKLSTISMDAIHVLLWTSMLWIPKYQQSFHPSPINLLKSKRTLGWAFLHYLLFVSWVYPWSMLAQPKTRAGLPGPSQRGPCDWVGHMVRTCTGATDTVILMQTLQWGCGLMRSYYNRDLQWRALSALPDQVVWRSSVHLGYARATCENGRTFITCNYSPCGNIFGAKVMIGLNLVWYWWWVLVGADLH